MNNTVKFCVAEGYEVKFPTKSHPADAGIDFYVPKFNQAFTSGFVDKNGFSPFHSTQKQRVLKPHWTYTIPLGICVSIPKGKCLLSYTRSGHAMKGLSIANSCVDAGYSGVIHAFITTGRFEWTLRSGDKICQFILHDCSSELVYASQEKIIEENKDISARADKGFGSSDND